MYVCVCVCLCGFPPYAHHVHFFVELHGRTYGPIIGTGVLAIMSNTLEVKQVAWPTPESLCLLQVGTMNSYQLGEVRRCLRMPGVVRSIAS